MVPVLPTAYFPPIPWFSVCAHHSEIRLEAMENYQRQTYRNRCKILTCNGVLELTVPVKKTIGKKQRIPEVEIDYSMPWQRVHRLAIRSAYGKSPFFPYYFDEFDQILNKNFRFLYAFNRELFETINRFLKIETSMTDTIEYLKYTTYEEMDFRSRFQPKTLVGISQVRPYIQTFADRYDFVPELSILDLLFNVGPESAEYL